MPTGHYPHKHKPRPIEIPIGPSIAYVPLSQGEFAVIDVEDIPKVEHLPWCYARGYAVAADNKARLFMHRVILGHDGFVDHRNHCGTHNFKGNIRPATKLQNNLNRIKHANNTSGYKGVSRKNDWSYRFKPWRATFRNKTLGYFATPEEAHEAYKKAASEFAGEFVCY